MFVGLCEVHPTFVETCCSPHRTDQRVEQTSVEHIARLLIALHESRLFCQRIKLLFCFLLFSIYFIIKALLFRANDTMIFAFFVTQAKSMFFCSQLLLRTLHGPCTCWCHRNFVPTICISLLTVERAVIV